MSEKDSLSSKETQPRLLNRRNLLRGAAGTVLGARFLFLKPAYAAGGDDVFEPAEGAQAKPIRGGVAPFAPFGVFIHHNPLNAALPLASLNDPSQIRDFDGFVGLTHIRGAGVGTNTKTGAMTDLAYQADMGFSQGKFIGIDGQKHNGAFAFV